MFRLSIVKDLFKYQRIHTQLRYISKGNNILYGKPIAERLLKQCTNECTEFINKYQCRPKLVAILVGGNESSKLYVRNKQRIAERVGCFIKQKKGKYFS